MVNEMIRKLALIPFLCIQTMSAEAQDVDIMMIDQGCIYRMVPNLPEMNLICSMSGTIFDKKAGQTYNCGVGVNINYVNTTVNGQSTQVVKSGSVVSSRCFLQAGLKVPVGTTISSAFRNAFTTAQGLTGQNGGMIFLLYTPGATPTIKVCGAPHGAGNTGALFCGIVPIKGTY